jgi:hypothetical protein
MTAQSSPVVTQTPEHADAALEAARIRQGPMIGLASGSDAASLGAGATTDPAGDASPGEPKT